MYTGWFAERFAREERLSSPNTYMGQFFDGEMAEGEAEAMAEAELTRMALQWGLDVVDLDDEPASA